ncbi:MAG: hypothetical protein GXP62_20430 [Oligoflexia bacterium]|nr:hypothetical protein [Oligoflexia bacterium]
MLPTAATQRRFHRLRIAFELFVLASACVLCLGPQHFGISDLALGRPTRDLFDHLALLDHWALRAPDQAFPDGGALFPPDLGGMLIAALPLAAGLPRATAWNLMVLVQLYLACVAAWALGRRYGAGLVAGLAYGLSPFLVGQALSGESETLSAWPLPLMVLLLEQAADRWTGRASGSPRWLLLGAGLVGALGALGAWYYGAFIAIYLCAWVGLRGWTSGRSFVRASLFAPLSFGVSIALPAVIYGRVLFSSDQLFRGPVMADYLARFPRSLAGMVADPAAFFGGPTAGAGHVDALGLTIVGLAVLGGWSRADGSRLKVERPVWWWGVVVVALVLSLGPVLTVRGAPVFAWMPYRALAHLPLFGLMRLPHRWLLVASLGLAVLAARGARRFPWLAAFLIWGEVTVFLVPARPTTDIAPPAIIAQVDAPVLDLPPRMIGLDARGHYLVWQRIHHQPIAYTLLMQGLGRSIAAEPLVSAIAGLDGRDPIAGKLSEAAQFRQEDFARAAATWRRGDGDVASLVGAPDRLRALGYGIVLLHVDLLDDDDAVAISKLLRRQLGEPSSTLDGDLLWRL